MKVKHIASASLPILMAAAAQGAINTSGLSLVQQGPTGNPVPSNLSSAGTAFSDGDFPNPSHTTAHLNDQTYGNPNSWISDADADGYAGISFGSSQSISSIAWGRDNLGAFTDRNAGTYTIQYRNDGSTANDAGWSTIGTATYTSPATSGLVINPDNTLALRHGYNFTGVNATAVRIVVPDPAGTALDEIELYNSPLSTAIVGSPPTPQGKITWNGNDGLNRGTTTVPANIAQTHGTPFADGAYPAAAHTVAHLTDGSYGNNNSWLSDPNGNTAYAGVVLDGLYGITSVAFGRDNSDAALTDRAIGVYTLQYTTVAGLNGASAGLLSETQNASTGWANVGILDYKSQVDGFTPYLRHEFGISDLSDNALQATALRWVLSNQDDAIDEIEIQGTLVPEPGTLTVLSLGALALLRRRRA